MEEGLLPHAQNIEDKEKLEEERRLCYVGMTRAKKRLYFTFASREENVLWTNKLQCPFIVLLDIPDHLLSDNSFRKEDDIWEDDFDDDEDDW